MRLRKRHVSLFCNPHSEGYLVVILHLSVILIDMPFEMQERKSVPQEKKDDQKAVDAQLMKAIEGVPDLKTYLSARFTLRSGMKPHELVF